MAASPVGAFGGREDVMQQIAPAGPIYQAGTLSGNPLAMVAGLSTLEHLTMEVYEAISKRYPETYRRLDGARSKRGHSYMRKSCMRYVQFVLRS